ncbi:MAG TPA: glycerol-3-phosphate dehydrogenase [Steroidobacteraceae bacterium]|nr:glycerol-3-phosphate dehydrogenase [Steroidobacteraceae bacterium]
MRAAPGAPVTPAALPHDLLVIGGGVNGAGIARDAAGRGLRVLLCEQDDLAAHTSSASTKLIHGGLRYLEHYEFRLVRKALAEREVLLAVAGHIIRPLRFVLPHEPHLRPAWMIRAGLFLYDHLARRRRLPGSEGVDLRHHPAGAPLRAGYAQGFAYSDAWVDDARLVVLNALDAHERGAEILTRTRCTRIVREQGTWTATLVDEHGARRLARARAVVNATGPWVGSFLDQATPVRSRRAVRLVKGSHVVVPRLFEHDYAYIFQNVDRRIIFAIPYEREFTLVGTTDVEFHGDAARARIGTDEISYLCELVSRHFRRSVSPAEVLWSYSGVRPLLEDESADPSSVTRDYSFELDADGAPLLSVFGGKLTTYRRLAEEALARLLPLLGVAPARWTATAPLPGGDLPGGGFAAFRSALSERYPGFPAPLLDRWARAYGTRLPGWLGAARAPGELGAEVLPGLYAAEIQYLRSSEWARTAEDILWRRSKLGLHLPPDAAAQLAGWLDREPAG